jgi:hypothetical protein
MTLGIGIRLLVEPLHSKRPVILKRINPSAPLSRSREWFAVGWTNFAVAPRCRQALNKPAQFHTAFGGLLTPVPDLLGRQVSLSFANLIQELHWV